MGLREIKCKTDSFELCTWFRSNPGDGGEILENLNVTRFPIQSRTLPWAPYSVKDINFFLTNKKKMFWLTQDQSKEKN